MIKITVELEEGRMGVSIEGQNMNINELAQASLSLAGLEIARGDVELTEEQKAQFFDVGHKHWDRLIAEMDSLLGDWPFDSNEQ